MDVSKFFVGWSPLVNTGFHRSISGGYPFLKVWANRFPSLSVTKIYPTSCSVLRTSSIAACVWYKSFSKTKSAILSERFLAIDSPCLVNSVRMEPTTTPLMVRPINIPSPTTMNTLSSAIFIQSFILASRIFY